MVSRFSIFDEIIIDVRRLIADVASKRPYSDPEIVSRIREAILTFNDVKGIATSRMLKYNFRAIVSDDPTRIDTSVYENVDNIKMNYQVELDNSSSEGSVETIAKVVLDKQIALLMLSWVQVGTTGIPVLDVSFDKNPDNGEVLRGTFLVDNSRIGTIENGVYIDTSMIVAETFSIKWSFPANSDYVIKDTMARVFLVDSAFMIQNQYDLANVAAANILKDESIVAAKDGQSETYVTMLRERAEECLTGVRGKIGGGVVASSMARAIDHGYDRSKYADRAFDKVSPEGTWVEIIGNEIIGRTIRYVE